MKTINLGAIRFAMLSVTAIALIAVIITGEIVPLAFLMVFIGVYLGVEAFVIFNIVYSLSQFIQQQVMAQQRMQEAEQAKGRNIDETLKMVKPN